MCVARQICALFLVSTHNFGYYFLLRGKKKSSSFEFYKTLSKPPVTYHKFPGNIREKSERTLRPNSFHLPATE